eukprot:scaffold125845_cov34-Tisochrysis_lutea.AAC.4
METLSPCQRPAVPANPPRLRMPTKAGLSQRTCIAKSWSCDDSRFRSSRSPWKMGSGLVNSNSGTC